MSTIATLMIRRPEPVPPARAEGRRLRTEIREGLHFVVTHPILRQITACTATNNFFGGGIFFTLVAVFLVRDLHASPGVIGVMFSVGSVGGLIGGAFAGRIGAWVGTARVIWLSMALSGPFQLIAVLAFRGWAIVLLAVGIFAATATGVVYNTAQVSYRQRICPPELLGRMNASVRFVWGTLPRRLAGGVLGEVIGVRPTLVIGALRRMGGHAVARVLTALRPSRRPRLTPRISAAACILCTQQQRSRRSAWCLIFRRYASVPRA